jgi:hypothetical protein
MDALVRVRFPTEHHRPEGCWAIGVAQGDASGWLRVGHVSKLSAPLTGALCIVSQSSSTVRYNCSDAHATATP